MHKICCNKNNQRYLQDNGQNWEEVNKIMLIRGGDKEGKIELRVDGGLIKEPVGFLRILGVVKKIL